MDISGIIFDFDGTLAELNIDFSLMKDHVKKMARSMGFFAPWPSGYLLEQVDEIALSLGEDFKKKAHQAIINVEVDAAKQGRLFPFSRKMLIEARQQGLGIAVVSRNCGQAILKVFPELNDYCDLFLPREKVTRPKPDPEHLETALRGLGLNKEKAIMVGDHPMDIWAAQKVGLRSLGVASGKVDSNELAKAGADKVLPNVENLLEALKNF